MKSGRKEQQGKRVSRVIPVLTGVLKNPKGRTGNNSGSQYTQERVIR
jgi:hypothetical protein